MASDFKKWLNEQLRALNTDESVFGSYILGILDGEETQDEKVEALEGILCEVETGNLSGLVSAILNKWEACQPQTSKAPTRVEPEIDVNAQLAKLLEQQKLQPATKEREYTAEERRIKAQILAQYSQTPVSDEEDDGSEHEETAANAAAASSLGFAPNTNKADVLALQKERREQARLDSATKKQKDKDDREKQKQLREEKKEKRKTQKGERRR